MTAKKFYAEYWKPLFMVMIPSILLTFFSSYSGVKIAIVEERKEREKLEQKLNQKLDSHLSEFTFYKAKDIIQGECLHRLELNQFSMAKDCKVKLPYTFEGLSQRGGMK